METFERHRVQLWSNNIDTIHERKTCNEMQAQKLNSEYIMWGATYFQIVLNIEVRIK